MVLVAHSVYLGTEPNREREAQMSECECSWEYGPCEDHGEAIIIREGASVRTADESACVLILDIIGLCEDVGETIDAVTSPYGHGVLARVEEDAAWSGPNCSGWLEDDGLRDELYSLADQMESYLPDGLYLFEDDGYVISRIIGGPLVNGEEH